MASAFSDQCKPAETGDCRLGVACTSTLPVVTVKGTGPAAVCHRLKQGWQASTLRGTVAFSTFLAGIRLTLLDTRGYVAFLCTNHAAGPSSGMARPISSRADEYHAVTDRGQDTKSGVRAFLRDASRPILLVLSFFCRLSSIPIPAGQVSRGVVPSQSSMPREMSGRLSLLVVSLASAIGGLAATTVSTDSTAYFEFETVQLTDESLSTLDSNTAALFRFYNETDTSANLAKRSACKVFPGDPSWPSNSTWETVNRVLGNNALIKTIPLAAPCYDAWGDYNLTECDRLTANWTNSYLQ
jgi:hypothetical protein